MPEEPYTTYAEIKARLDEIAAATDDESMPIDDALSLYEEAVKLGLAASSLIEQDIEARDAEDAQAEKDDAEAQEDPAVDAAPAETEDESDGTAHGA